MLTRLVTALVLGGATTACDKEPTPSPSSAPSPSRFAADTATSATPEPIAAPPPPPSPADVLRDQGYQYAKVEIQRSLEADLARVVGATTAPSLAQVTKRVLVWWIDPRRDLRKQDRLELVWRPRPREEPVVHAVWIDSGKLRGPREAVRLSAQGQPPRWVAPEQGVEVALRLKHSPLPDYEEIISLLNDGRRHRGVDFKAAIGTPVLAPFAGEVLRVNWGMRSNGRCVKLRNTQNGREAMFLHLSRVDPAMKVGRMVKRGQKLGEVGNTGRSYAPHLHYQLERGGRVLDPFRVQPTFRVRLSEEERTRARAQLDRWALLRNSEIERE